MATVTITRGLPASGKSTAAIEMVNAADGRVRRVNLDALRLMLDDNDGHRRLGRRHEDVVLAAQDAAVLAAVDGGFDVVIDNTHLTPRLPRHYARLLGTRDVTFELLDFTHVPIEECIRRDAARDRTVGEQVIRDMARQLKSGPRWTAAELNDRPTITPYTPDWTLPPAVLCDIDGTLALHAGGRGPYELEKCEQDLVNRPVAEALKSLVYSTRIVLLSGRQSEYREHTVRWLVKHGIAYDELWMRPTGDRRPDDLVKAELFDAHVRHRFAVRFVLDDRDRVVSLWRRMGLSCWQVNYGAF